MIVRVLETGRYMPGLVRYLVGPGKANEHTDPHLVTASGPLAEEFAGAEWDAAKAGELAAVLDGAWREARRAAGLTVLPDPGERASGAQAPGHVFHASLSLAAEEGQLSDEQWGQIAREYVEAMDFTAAGGKAECQWAAVRHGLSSRGNDHVHVVVCLVREDGTRASEWQSKLKSRRAADAIEVRHGLRPVKDAAAERGMSGHTAAEAAKAARTGQVEPQRYALARALRAVAATSASEADFVRGARATGVLVRPRFAQGRTDVVTGYSAAARPGRGERPVWYGGSTLDRNLALPALRRTWADTPQAASEGVAEWVRAHRHRPLSKPAPGLAARSAVLAGGGGTVGSTAAVQAVAEVNARLAQVDPGDREAWRHAAREAAGVFAMWSVHVEGTQPGALARASDALARSAQPVRGQEQALDLAQLRMVGAGMGGRHVQLAARASSPRAAAGWLAVLHQLDRTTQAIHDAHTTRGEAVRARAIAAEAGHGLAAVREQLQHAATAPPAPGPAAARASQGPQAGAAPGPSRAARAMGARWHEPRRPGQVPPSLGVRPRERPTGDGRDHGRD